MLIVVSILANPEFAPNDHREDTPHFIKKSFENLIQGAKRERKRRFPQEEIRGC